jgi:glycosyltransferase involved in cell wall biosynthesis
MRERLTYDVRPLRAPVAWTIWIAARILLVAPSRRLRGRAFHLLTRLHSGAFSPAVDHRIVDTIRKAGARPRRGEDTGLGALYDQRIRVAVATFRAGANPDPKRLIGSRLLVLKAWNPGERGVLVVDYSYVFPLLAGLFNLQRIADRYMIVLEPSWAGACTPEILLYSRLRHPVFVQTIEPRDRDLLARLDSNLEAVPIAANWWVDHRQAPVVNAPRDIDVIMVAAWSDIKRHWRVFKTLAALKARGQRLRVALVGYRYDRTKADIEGLADYFGIRDQIETYERVPQDEVSRLLARSKVHVLWSRRECANRAIIEAMLADVPVIVREGLTFGFRYPYINEHTGRFVAEADLGSVILEMIATRERYTPREWILAHMTAERATAALEATLRERALATGVPWTAGLVVKTSTLDTQRYWNLADRARFAADYAFLESTLVPVGGGA